MLAVILAAGEGVRMRPLTLTTPKPLLRVGGQTLLDYIVSALPDDITDLVIVVHYLGDQIRRYCGETFHGRRVQYAEGSERGTAYSFLAAAPLVADDRFLFLYGDELPDPKDIRAALVHDSAIVCWEVDDPWNHGVATLALDGTIVSLEEKPANPSSRIIADGIMTLRREVFNCPPQQNKNGEFFFTSMVAEYVRRVPTRAVISKQGIGGISTPADIERVDRWLQIQSNR
jgi:bifunctional UDP-N-acetylglucosamine pyrophosphorylase/glucosamine-1-phosphate N-acetyltransferase